MSLVGVFITASSIVVGADTAVKERGTAAFEVGRKLATCGSRVVGLTGSTSFAINQHMVDSLADAREACKTLPAKATVREGAEEIAKAIARRASAAFQFVGDDGYQYAPRNAAGVLLTFIFAGFDGISPVVVSGKLVLSAANRAYVVSDVEVQKNCASAIGLTDPANALLDGHPAIPADWPSRPEVAAIRSRPPCKTLSASQARDFFRLAVETSYSYAEAFNLTRGIVNWPIDFVEILPTGVGSIQRTQRPEQKR
jgi:hypothetical protein